MCLTLSSRVKLCLGVLSPLHPNGIVLPKLIAAIHPSHELVEQRDRFGAAESTARTIPCLPLYSCSLSRIRVGGDQNNWAIVLPQRNSRLCCLTLYSPRSPSPFFNNGFRSLGKPLRLLRRVPEPYKPTLKLCQRHPM